MASPLTVQSVLDSVVSRLHLPTPGPSEFITEPIALDLLQSSFERLSALLVRSFSDGYFAQTATLQTQPGLDLVSMPANFSTLRSVHWLAADGRAYPLQRADVHEYDETTGWTEPNPFWSCGALPRVTLEANVLRFVPTPTEIYTLRVAYTTGFYITALSDVVPANLGFKEWLVNDVCEMVRQREQKDASDFTRRRMEAEMNIVSQGAQRDRYSTYQVRNSRRDGFPLPRYGRRWV